MNPFVSHLVGDFILQNEWMALNKKTKLICLSGSCSCVSCSFSFMPSSMVADSSYWELSTLFKTEQMLCHSWWMHKWKRMPFGKGAWSCSLCRSGISHSVDRTCRFNRRKRLILFVYLNLLKSLYFSDAEIENLLSYVRSLKQ